MPLVALDLDGTLVDQASAAREWVSEFVVAWDLPASAGVAISAQLAQRRSKGERATTRATATTRMGVS